MRSFVRHFTQIWKNLLLNIATFSSRFSELALDSSILSLVLRSLIQIRVTNFDLENVVGITREFTFPGSGISLSLESFSVP